MKCPECHYDCAPHFNFCPRCGATLAHPSPPLDVSTPTLQAPKPAPFSTPLVDRQAALAALQARVRDLADGRGSVVNLIGETGIGKSRLVAELRTESPLPVWLTGRALSLAEKSPYGVWLELIRDWLGSAESQAEPDARHSLRQQVARLFHGSLSGARPEVYAYLARLLSLPLEADTAEHLAQLDQPSQQAQTFFAVRAWLERLAQDCPAIVVMEDLQWTDAISLALLLHVLPLVEHVPLLLINIFRPDENSACEPLQREGNALLAHQGRYTEIFLDRLSSRESDALIKHLLPGESLPPGLLAKVGARAEGNPLFIEEIVRTLVESGTLVYDATHRVWLTTTPIDQVRIPTTLQDVFNTRIAHLPDAARHVLQHAAVVGRVFWEHAVAWVMETPADHPVAAQLEPLVAAGLIEKRAAAPVWGAEYLFKHALAHQAVYEATPDAQRRACHRRVADFIEAHFADHLEDYSGLLAHHTLRAGDEEHSCYYAQQAAQRAAGRYANQEAVQFYQQALSLLPTADIHSRALRFDLLHGLQRVYARLGQVHAQERTLNEMLRLASLLADSQRLVEVYSAQAALYLGANLERAEESARAGLRLARVMDNPGGEAQALLQQAWVDRRLWRKRQAITRGEAALEASRRAGDQRLEGRVLCDLADFHAFAYDFETALRRSLETLEISQAVGDRSIETEAQLIVGRNLSVLGRHSEAVAHTQASVALARQIGDRRREATSLNALGRAYSEAGQHEKAIETFQEALAIYRQIGDRIYESWLHGNIGWMYIRCGDYAAALEAFQKSHQTARRIDNRSVEARALMAMASLRRQVGQYAQAQQLAQTARAIVPHGSLNQGRREIERWALGELSLMAWWRGEFSLALGLAQTALGYACDQQDQQAIGWDMALVAAVHQGWPWFKEPWGTGNLELAQRLASRAEAIGRQTCDRFVQIWGAEVLGLTLWRTGHFENALDCSGRAVALLDDTPGYPTAREPLYFEHSLVLRANGLTSEADVYLKRASDEMSRKAERLADAEMRRTYLEQVPINRAIRGAG